MNEERKIRPIAHIHTDFPDKFGIPRQSGRSPSLRGTILFEKEFRSPEAFREISSFEYLWLIFDFSMSHQTTFVPTVRPPRLGGNRHVGVFASRSPFRPNSLGLSCVKLETFFISETDGPVLIVSGVDLCDGTPIYDIKPYLPFSDAHPDAKDGYASQGKFHRLSLCDPDDLLSVVKNDKQDALRECLCEDPRPSYQNDPERVYRMTYSEYNISFRCDGDTVYIIEIEERNPS